MKICLFRNGKSSKSKVVPVPHLREVPEERAQTATCVEWLERGEGSWKERVGTGRGGRPQEGHTYGLVEITLQEKHLDCVVTS